jgi:hypothetical protein
MKLLYKLALLQLCLLYSIHLQASHVAGGDITYRCLGNDQYLVTLNLFSDCAGIPLGSTQTVNLSSSCGQTFSAVLPLAQNYEVSQLCSTDIINSTCNGGVLPGYMQNVYEDIITIAPPCDTWTIAWDLCCRNGSINLAGQASIYLEATLNSQTAACNNSPAFNTINPMPIVCVNQWVYYNYWVSEQDGNNLVYSLIEAKSAAGVPVPYNVPFSGSDPITGISVDAQTGEVAFISAVVGNYVVVILVEEYDSAGNLVGTTYRDMQFTVLNCASSTPMPPAVGGITNVTGTANQTDSISLEMCPGDNFCFDFIINDNDVSDTINIVSNVASALPGGTVTTLGTNPVTVSVCWTATSNDIGFHSLIIHGDDNACPIPGIFDMAFKVNVIEGTKAGPDVALCGSVPVQLNATGGNVFTWSVLSGDPIVVGNNFSCNPCASPLASPAVTTTYLVTSDLGGACIITDTVTVAVTTSFSIVTQGPVGNCNPGSAQLSVIPTPPNAGYIYTWNTSDNLSDSTIANPITSINTLGNTTYYVTVVDSNGCIEQDSVTIINYQPDALASASDTIICWGDSVQLFTIINGSSSGGGWQDDFDPIADNALWGNIANGTENMDCGSMTGNALHFDGAAAPREATTVPLDATTCINIDFCLFIANANSGGAPCENADPGENVELQYSIDGGTTWNTIVVYDQMWWDTGEIYDNAWACFSVAVPVAAQTPATMFKWVQPLFSACAGCDNWAIDDVSIGGCVSSSIFNYAWAPSATLNDATLSDPFAGPTSSTTYTVIVSDTGGFCSDTASINIQVYPQIITLPITGPTPILELTSGTYSTTATTGSTYNWLVTGGAITSGQGTASIDVLWGANGTGQIAVVETDQNGCMGDTVFFNVTIDDINGVDENQNQNEITTYPNPAKDRLNVQFDNEGIPYLLEILDITGRILNQQNNLTGKINSIDCSNLSSGTYFVRIIAEGTYVKKVFIKR